MVCILLYDSVCQINNRSLLFHLTVPLFSRSSRKLGWSDALVCAGVIDQFVGFFRWPWLGEPRWLFTVNVTCGQVATWVDPRRSTQWEVSPLSLCFVWTRWICAPWIFFWWFVGWQCLYIHTGIVPYNHTAWPQCSAKSRLFLGGLQWKNQPDIHTWLANLSGQKSQMKYQFHLHHNLDFVLFFFHIFDPIHTLLNHQTVLPDTGRKLSKDGKF